MDSAKKKQLYLIGGIAAAVLVVLAVVLLLTLGGGSKGYDKHYDAAEQAFLHRDMTRLCASWTRPWTSR